MIRALGGRIWKGLGDLGRECLTLESLAVLAVTLVLVTRNHLGSQQGARQLAWLWSALSDQWLVFIYPLFQRQALAVLLQLVVPVVLILAVHRRSLRDFGLGLGDVKFWLPLTAVIFAVQIIVIACWLSQDPVYVRRYPTFALARGGGALFWAWEASRLCYMLSWEFLFRGYLLFALEKRLGLLACVVQTMPFVLMHIVSHKPVSEIYFTVASGVLSGLFVLLCRSVWPVVWLHAMGAILLDVFIVYR